jgi:tetratricopeptide (TPR) repeat protein
MVVFSWISWVARSRQREQHRLVAQAVRHATGEVPEELEAGAQKLNSGGIFGGPFLWIGTGVAYFVLRMIWHQAPYWSALAIGLAIHLAMTFRQSLVKRRPKPSDPIGPGAPSRYNWSKTWKAVAGSAVVLLLINLDRLPMFHFLRGYWLLAVVLVPGLYHGIAVGLLNRALRRGDYDGALNIIRWSHFYNPAGINALRMSGHVLLAAGRYWEAEDTLRRSLASSQASESYGSALEFLGDALLEQGRYDEAMRSYEAALQAFPWRRRPYRGMAEMLLRRDQNPARALEYVEKIVDFSGLSWRQRKMNGRPQDDYWALKAWALARLGRGSEVAAAVEEAVKYTSKECFPDLACTHYRAGMAMQALGNPTAAREHFRLAVQFDPKGRRGTLANAALRETSVWRMVSV